MDQPSSIQEAINQALGLPIDSSVACVLLLQGRQFVGYRVSFDGGHAIWRADTGIVEVFDEANHLLKTVPVHVAPPEIEKAA
jgi:hypothetical protein